jgi:hypothetical protein
MRRSILYVFDQLLESSLYCPTSGMTEDDRQTSADVFSGKLDTRNL